MKIKKIVPEDVKSSKLGYKDYRKVVKPALKAMLTQHLGAIDGFDIDPGEYSKIKAGYIYFFVRGNYKMVYRPNEFGYLEGQIEYKSGNFSYKPVLDDVVGGANAIQVLRDLYGNNAKLVDLPIKLKLKAELTISDPADFFGGAAGLNTLVFDRDISGNWTGVSDAAKQWDTKFKEAERKAGKKMNLKEFIEKKLLSD